MATQYSATVWPAMVYPQPSSSKVATPAPPVFEPFVAPAKTKASVNFTPAAPQPNTTTYINPATTEAQRRAFFNITVDQPPSGS